MSGPRSRSCTWKIKRRFANGHLRTAIPPTVRCPDSPGPRIAKNRVWLAPRSPEPLRSSSAPAPRPPHRLFNSGISTPGPTGPPELRNPHRTAIPSAPAPERSNHPGQETSRTQTTKPAGQPRRFAAAGVETDTLGPTGLLAAGRNFHFFSRYRPVFNRVDP